MNIATFCTEIESLILSTTPSYLAEFRYKLAPKNRPIGTIDDGDTTERSFQVVPGNVVGIGIFNCGNYATKIELHVVWRYNLPLADDNNYIEMLKISTADAADTVRTIIQPNVAWSAPIWGCTFESDGGLQLTEEGLYVRQLTFVVEL